MVVVAAAATIVHHLGTAGNGHNLVIQLFLLQAAIVDPFDLHAYLLYQALGCVAHDGAGAATWVSVLVRIEAHVISSLYIQPFRGPYTPHGMKGGLRCARATVFFL